MKNEVGGVPLSGDLEALQAWIAAIRDSGSRGSVMVRFGTTDNPGLYFEMEYRGISLVRHERLVSGEHDYFFVDVEPGRIRASADCSRPDAIVAAVADAARGSGASCVAAAIDASTSRRIARWLQAHADGDWEHSNGFSVALADGFNWQITLHCDSYAPPFEDLATIVNAVGGISKQQNEQLFAEFPLRHLVDVVTRFMEVMERGPA